MTWIFTIIISIAGFKFAAMGTEKSAFASAFAVSLALTFLSIITGEMPQMAYILIFTSYFSLVVPVFFFFNDTNSMIIANVIVAFTIILLLLGGPINLLYTFKLIGQ